MSAFVVHDLKNIVTQLSLMMKNAKRLRDNPEFQQDMCFSIEPGIYLPERFGVRIEDIVTATNDGGERLNNTSHEMRIVS